MQHHAVEASYPQSAQEKDETRQGSLEGCVEKWTPELRSIFVQPSWLSAAWQQTYNYHIM